MVCSTLMMPSKAFAEVATIPETGGFIAADGLPDFRDCPSPLDQWLQLPSTDAFFSKQGMKVLEERLQVLALRDDVSEATDVSQIPRGAWDSTLEASYTDTYQALCNFIAPAFAGACLQPDKDSPYSSDQLAPLTGYYGSAVIENDSSVYYFNQVVSTVDCSKSPNAESGSSDDRSCITASAARRLRRQRAGARSKHGNCAGVADDHMVQVEGAPYLQHDYLQFAEQLEGGCTEMMEAIEKLSRKVRKASFDRDGCRAVQKALDACNQQQAVELVSRLRGCVRSAITSPYGNYVIQKVVEVLPVSLAGFIVEELMGFGAEASRHRYGCRVLCRLLEHSATGATTIALIDEVLNHVEELCYHNFGQYVIEGILEHGLPRQKHAIATVVLANMPDLQNSKSWYVVDMGLKHCPPSDQHALAMKLVSDASVFTALAANSRFSNLALAVMRMPGDPSRIARSILQPVGHRLSTTASGRQLLKEL